MVRRTSFRLKSNNSVASSSTEESEDFNNSQIDLDKRKTIPSLYPVSKNLSYLSKIQKIQSNSSSTESLTGSSTLSSPPSNPLPLAPNDQAKVSATTSTGTNSTAGIHNTNNSTTSFPQIKLNLGSVPGNSSKSDEAAQKAPPLGKMSLSQRRGMKLDLNSFNRSGGNTAQTGSGNSSGMTENNTSHNDATATVMDNFTNGARRDNLDNRPALNSTPVANIDGLKNKMNNLTLNSSIKNNRLNMNKLRENSIPARRNPMNLNLSGLNGGAPIAKPSGLKIQKDNGFTSYAKYIDVKSGSLNFAGKASLHSKGIDFSNGSSFRISMDDLEILEELGHGNYGVVSKVLHRPTGIIMAMKEVRLELDDSKFRQILMELEVLHSCNSDFIVEFYGAFFVEGAVYMCMEFMKGGSLDKVYSGGVPEIPLAYITKRVVNGLKQLKDEQNIIHRDVKPTNMLVNEGGKVKLCDFGVSGNLVASLARTNIGCQSYMAPERIKHTNPDVSTYSVQSDVWSLGLSILEISKGCYPYPPETYNNVFSQLSAIVDGEAPELPVGKYSLEAQDFVRQCLHKNPNKRPNYGQLLMHPWLNMYSDIQGEELLRKIVLEAIDKRVSGKSNKKENLVPALHSGIQR